MRDRTSFFRSHYKENEAVSGQVSIVIQDPLHEERGNEIRKFLRDAYQMREKVVQIEGLISQIRQFHSKITGTASRNEEVHKQLKRAVDEIGALFDAVKLALKTMGQQHKDLEISDAARKGHRTADVRILSSQHTTLQRWFFETWTEYNECQNEYRERCKNKLVRQMQITDKKLTNEEIDDMIEKGDITVFSHNAAFQPKDLEELESRQKDITKLAESLKKLHEMFKDLALMVEQQGEMLNNIERGVENAREYTQEAVTAIVYAEEETNKWRKKKFICGGILLAILIVIAIVIAVTIKIQSD